MAFHHMYTVLGFVFFPILLEVMRGEKDNSARCVFRGFPGNTTVTGTIEIRQVNNTVRLTGDIVGLNPGNHGFHIHSVGSIENNCNAAGGHYNPLNRTHGDVNTSERHVGDLGNISANMNGVATVNIQTGGISLNGATSVIGRALVIHANQDDLGTGNDAGSKTTGNSGARIGCCVIFRIS